MKAICIATGMTLVLLLAVTLALRWSSSRQRVLLLTALYVFFLVVLAALWWVTPNDLGFLPASLVAQPPWLDALACLFFFSAAFFGGILQLYNLADRGFSLRILIDARESRSGTCDVDSVLTGYSRGRGMAWMYRKRLDGMLQRGFIRADGGQIQLAHKGARAATVFGALRRFSRLDTRV